MSGRLDAIKEYAEELNKHLDTLKVEEQQKTELKEIVNKITLEANNFEKSYLDFREVSDKLYDAIHITDGEGKIIFVNEAYARTTGIFPEEILGKYVKDVEASGEKYRGAVTPKVIEQKKRVSGITHFYPLDKEILSTGSPVFDSKGKLKYVVTNVRDISGLEDMKQKLDRMTEKAKKDKEELEYLRRNQVDGESIASHNEEMKATLEMARIVAETDVTVLITGESGAGKEKIAEEIYRNSKRRDKPFIKVNCAAIPAELLESELFGYEAGAFTDASRNGKRGMFELANGGVILLDEIGDMPIKLQTKLLRVLQEKEIMRIGGSRYLKLDIRVLAATNRDLKSEIEKGNFREDLYYRLNVVPINVIPLRERKEDIPYMTMEFLRKYCKKYGKDVTIDKDGMDIFVSYQWPGNIRELKNFVERLVVVNKDGVISKESIIQSFDSSHISYNLGDDNKNISLKDYVRAYEKSIIAVALKEGDSKRKTAQRLGIDHATLIRKCREYKLE